MARSLSATVARCRAAADDVVRCGSLENASKDRVRRLLGPPQRPESNPRMWLWTVGTERGPIKLRPETLRVRFTRDDLVREVRISD